MKLLLSRYRDTKKIALLLFLPFLVLFLGNCSNKYVNDIKRGAGYNYQFGYPELRVDVSGFIDQNKQTKLQLTGNVVKNSLIFKNSNNQLNAEITILIQAKNLETDKIETLEFNESIAKNPSESIYGEEIFIFEKEIKVTPGNYKVTIAVTDVSSKKTTTRETQAFLPNPNEKISNITNIRILAKDNSDDLDFMPVTTYDVTMNKDSLKFVFQVTNNDPGNPITIQSRLIKFDADTSIARAMHFNNYSPSNMSYKGIEYDQYEIIQSSRRSLTQSGSVLIEFVYTNLERGNYRFEVAKDLNKKGPLYKARDFSLKSENYPSVKTPSELARPLYYLMGDGEYKDLMSINSPDSLKKAIDRFWLQEINNSQVAKNVISLYYQRVEEANKQFSNFKEGWKTDAGKIYILFGPPWYIDKHLSSMQWAYSYDRSDPDFNFYFSLPKTKSNSFPFENFILQRNNQYFTIEYQQIELWKTGHILTQNL